MCFIYIYIYIYIYIFIYLFIYLFILNVLETFITHLIHIIWDILKLLIILSYKAVNQENFGNTSLVLTIYNPNTIYYV